MKRMITLLLAVLMICALTVSAYADDIHTDASPFLPSLGSALSQGNIIILDASLDGAGNVKLSEKYIDAENVKTVTANDTAWGAVNSDTWYICADNVTVNGRINIAGRVHLILKDGCVLTAENGIRLTEGNTLSVFAQSDGENCGRLVANGNNGNAAIGGNAGFGDGSENEAAGTDGENAGTLNVFGGIITATAYYKSSVGIGGGYGIKGVDGNSQSGPNVGIVNATNGTKGGNGGIVNIYSGIVTANGSVGIGGGRGGKGGKGAVCYSHLEGFSSKTIEVTLLNVGDGGKGGDGSILCVYGGVLNASGGTVAVGGGNGGNGGDRRTVSFAEDVVVVASSNYYDSSGGDGGAGGIFTVKGGTVTLNGGIEATGGGQGGLLGYDGGYDNKKKGHDGQNGADTTFTFAENCTLKAGDSEATATEVSTYNGKNYLSVVGKQVNAVGSVFSEGNFAIILGVAGVAIGLIGGLMIRKKKQKN